MRALVVALIALPASLGLAEIAHAQVYAGQLGSDLSRTVCSEDAGTHTLTPEEATTYDSQDISGRHDGWSAVFWFQKMGGGDPTCRKQWQRTVGGTVINICERAAVNRAGAELRRAGWISQACGS